MAKSLMDGIIGSVYDVLDHQSLGHLCFVPSLMVQSTVKALESHDYT
jgi:hypothetical protein